MDESKINQSLLNSRASVEFEHLSVSKESDDICKRFLNNEITNEEANRLIVELHIGEDKPNTKTTYIVGETFTNDKYTGVIYTIDNGYIYVKCSDGLSRCFDAIK